MFWLLFVLATQCATTQRQCSNCGSKLQKFEDNRNVGSVFEGSHIHENVASTEANLDRRVLKKAV